MVSKSFLISFILVLFLPASGIAQSVDISNLRRSVDILTGILEEGLRINESPGLFGINLGQVSGVYLQRQGVVVEIRSPLASRRNRLSLDALTFNIQSLPLNGSNPFVQSIPLPDAPEIMPLSLNRGVIAQDYRLLIDRIGSTDYSALINAALRQANQSLRSLQDMGAIEERALEQQRVETEQLRTMLRSRQQELENLITSLQQRLQNVDSQSAPQAGDAHDDLQPALDALVESMAQLRDAASAKAEELRSMHDAARQRVAEEWRAEVVTFENTMYELLCEYGSTLRDLPDNEYLTVILSGLGEDGDESSPADKIHVVGKGDLQQCQSGAIGAASLMQRASSYSY